MPAMPLRLTALLALALLLGPFPSPAWSQGPPKPPPVRPGSALPKSPAEREKTLADLYALLATADDEESAKAIADAIERVWVHSGSATIDLLMERSIKAMNEKKVDLALKLLDQVVELAPEFLLGFGKCFPIHAESGLHLMKLSESPVNDLGLLYNSRQVVLKI